jgi:archaeosine synthase beta-subunit
VSTAYPASPRERDEWILSHRPARNVRDPWVPYAFYVEEERAESGEVVPVATIFLTNRECPWHCVMCDLWRDTLSDTVPHGAISAQIEYALQRLPAARQVKLYNAGSFFDAGAIPRSEFPLIAKRVGSFEHVIVECHPALIGGQVSVFNKMIGGRLEVAMGLETIHPVALEKLNKRVTPELFAKAAAVLRECGIPLRVFVLVQPPFVPADQALEWANRSVDFAFECGAAVVSLIPTRGGNGAMEVLAGQGLFTAPRLVILEASAAYGINAGRNFSPRPRVFADLWDIEKFSDCAACFEARRTRLDIMNRRQDVLPGVACTCEG